MAPFPSKSPIGLARRIGGAKAVKNDSRSQRALSLNPHLFQTLTAASHLAQARGDESPATHDQTYLLT